MGLPGHQFLSSEATLDAYQQEFKTTRKCITSQLPELVQED
jgi:hypothetical protein